MPTPNSRGFTFALLSVLLWTTANLLGQEAFRANHNLSGLTGTLVRVLVNLACVLAVQILLRGETRLPWGNRSGALWIWGLLGAVTILSYFAALRLIGAAETTLLQASQGLVVAAVGPLAFQRSTGRREWIAVVGGLLGTALVLGADISETVSWGGRSLALLSGISAGWAYLVLANGKRSHRPETVSFYWCLLSLAAVLLLAACSSVPLVFQGPGMSWLFGAGLAASGAQWLTTLAYQQAPAAYVSASNYLVPVLSLAFESQLFGKQVSLWSCAGGVVVVVCGGALPLLVSKKAALHA